MKPAYKILASLSVAFLLSPSALAQSDPDHEKYHAYPQDGVGLNKYLVSNEPDENGMYTLRLETFTTGTVTEYAIPTDFVLVLDCSGSMLEDCLFGKTRPEYVTKAQMEDPNDDYYQFLRPAHSPENLFQGISRYTYNYGYSTGSIGTSMSESGLSNSRTTWSYFNATADSPSSSLYYFYEPDATYYKINRELQGGYRLIGFTRTNGQKLYVVCTQSGSTVTTTVSETAPKSTLNNASNKVLLVGYEGDNIYRPVIRVEELIPGYKAFIQSIYDHNTQDHFASGVTKHQVSVVAFGNGLSGGNVSNPNITPSTAYNSSTRVVKGFAEINAESQAQYKSAIDDYFQFRGGTSTFLGILLARKLLEALQARLGGTNRNKVVVIFTDGAPKAITDAGGSSGGTVYNNVRLSLNHARAIKALRTSASGTEINGKFFSIDFCDNEYASNFLRYLSSNYPDGAATGGPEMNQITYSGTLLPKEEDRIYYADANASGALERAFCAIADASTGDSEARYVAVDVISNSFDFPAGLTPSSDKVKLFTAQCVGTKEIDGQTYLAFTNEVPVGTRPALDEIWYESVDEDGNVSWEKKENVRIDTEVECVIDAANKKLIVKGFDFAKLWCGLDEMADHHNTRQIQEGDLNYDHQVAGYRGFKMVVEFPIVVAEGAVGGPDVPTNTVGLSGLFKTDEEGNPEGNAIVNFPEPSLTVPVRLVIQKKGLKPGESASFTLQRRKAVAGTQYKDYTTFILTGTAAGEEDPIVRMVNLDPAYYYRVKENGWSWAYENSAQVDATCPTTEDPDLVNPIVVVNTAKTDTPRHAEAKVTNRMRNF